MDLFQVFSILIALAAIFSYINFRYFRMPTTIGVMLIATVVSLALVVAGKFESSIHAQAVQMLSGINFDTLLLNGMLGFLLFAGALHIDLSELASQWLPVLLLAIVGTVISAVLIACLTWLAARALSIHLTLPYCMLFGALISPTDPIAVLGIMRRVGAPKVLEMQIAGESLFNDGVGIVMFV
ncbi:MAG TPA: cation:proton antiporter, partial [Tepidisphaeraceae bacterium]|nr:cation:proton antiporter [Tepidisphaeraceae bacterium]